MLNKFEIGRFIEDGNIEIIPFYSGYVNPNSYDVCLGNWFVRLTGNHKFPFSAPYYIPDGDRITLISGTTTLAMTKEVIGTHNNCVAELRSKSSTRRRGITICDDAGFGDIGYRNHWTVELTAHIPIGAFTYLEVGMPFAQVVFFQTGHLPVEHQYNGQYVADEWPACMIPKSYRDEWMALYHENILNMTQEKSKEIKYASKNGNNWILGE